MSTLGRSMQPIDLHLVSWNRPKMTELVIKTIHRNTKRDSFRLVVLDNGSGRPNHRSTRRMLQIMQDSGYIDELILLPQNIGLEPARSKLLYEATYSDYFVCIDNDCLPPPPSAEAHVGHGQPAESKDWLEQLYDLMQKYEEYAAISCRTQVMIGTGNIFEEADETGADLVPFPWPGGSLRIMKTRLTRKIGGWRETPGRGQEERHIGAKLAEAGYKTGFAAKIPCLHLFGTREGGNSTDRWGYSKRWKPARSGHNNVWHPALINGDDFVAVSQFCGEELAKEYFDA